MLQIKEEPGDTEVDIGSTIQMDSRHRTNQKHHTIVVKQESTTDNKNVDTTLCYGVKQEFIEIELTAVDEQKCAQVTSIPAGAGSVNVASSSLNQDAYIKVELEEADLRTGPSVFQHMDLYNRINQPNTGIAKREDLIASNRNDSLLCKRVKKKSVEDKPGYRKSHIYTCDYCQKTFPAKSKLVLHMSCVHASESHKCNQCKKYFRCEKYLMVHKRTVHSTDMKKCNVCSKYLKSFSLKQHMFNVHSDKRRMCNLCGETVKSEQHLHLHLRDVHGQQPANAEPRTYICDYCQKAFPKKTSIISHINHTHARGSYKCNQCEKSFTCRQYLMRHKTNMHVVHTKKCNICGTSLRPMSLRCHMQRMHGDEQLQCVLCGETIKSKYYFQQHMNGHRGQPSAVMMHKVNMHIALMEKCNVCGISVKPVNMGLHMQRMHSDEQLQCNVCGENVKSKYYFQQHMNSHCDQPPASNYGTEFDFQQSAGTCGTVTASHLYNDVTSSEQQLQSGVYSCDKCVQTFTSEDTFKQHNRLAHLTEPDKHNERNKEFTLESYFHKHTGHDGKLQYECAVCKKIYKSRDGLRGHVLKYHQPRSTGSEPNVYICDYCQRMFVRKSKIIDHISCVHARGFYKCNLCERSFKCKKYLKGHKNNVHTALTNKCNVCGKAIMGLRNLKRHMLTMHNDAKLQCKICGEIMMSTQHLHQHMNNIHDTMLVRPYKRKTCRAKIDENDVASAVSDVLEGRLSIRRAADKYNLHAATLQRRIKKKKALLESNQQFTCSKFGEGSGESTHPPVGRPNAETSASTQQQNFVNIKEEPAEEKLELGPVAFQHMDCNYRPYKKEPPLD